MSRSNEISEFKPNLLDRVIQFVSPERAFRRAEAREALTFFGYDAANPGPLRGRSGGASKNGSPESPKMQRDAIQIMWDARDVCRNGTLLGGILRRTVRYCFGKLAYKSSTGERVIDKQYEDYFHEWCSGTTAGKTMCDLTGRASMKNLTRMGFYCMKRDRDFGFIKVRKMINGKPVLRLQSIQADRIGNPLDPGVSILNEFYISGVNIDPETGEPVSYRIYKRNRLGLQYTFDKEVPAPQFIHLMKPDDTDQYRPVSWLQPALADARDLNEIWGFVKQRCKFASMHSGMFVGNDDRFNKTGAAQWDTPEDKANGMPASINAQAGKLLNLIGQNIDVKWAPAMNEPAGAFMNLFETGIRKIAVALDLPYGFVWDMAIFGGVTARLEAMSADRVFKDDRELATECFLRDVKNEVLALGIAVRDLPPHPNFRNGQFHFGSRLTADVGHETAALIQARDAGFTSTTRIAEEWYDEDFDDLCETQASEVQHKQEVAARTGVPIELQDTSKPNATALLAAINTPPAPPPQPPPGLVGEQGDKGVQPLLDVLEKVGDGHMDRESAINTLMELYDLSYIQADKMVPEPKKLPRDRNGMNGNGRNGRNGNSREPVDAATETSS